MNAYLHKLFETEPSRAIEIFKSLSSKNRRRPFEQIYTMTEELGLDEIDDYHERVRLRWELIQKYPDVVFWDHPEYLSKKGHSRISRTLVSTEGGTIVTNKKIGSMYLNPATIPEEGAYRGYRRMGIDNEGYGLHRVVASTFIPIPPHLCSLRYDEILVNHIDHEKFNNNLSNLEWVSYQGNVRHALEHKDYDNAYLYFKLKVIVDNGFLGREFVLHRDQIVSIGASKNIACAAAAGRIKSFRGLELSFINKEDIGNYFCGFPEDIKELYQKNMLYFSTVVSPVRGEVMVGEHKGLVFSLFGAKEGKRYFGNNALWEVKLGRTVRSCGCVFTPIGIKDAIPLHGIMTDEIAEGLRKIKGRKY